MNEPNEPPFLSSDKRDQLREKIACDDPDCDREYTTKIGDSKWCDYHAQEDYAKRMKKFISNSNSGE